MADKTIGTLPRVTQVNDNDLFVLEQGGAAKSLAGSLLKNYARQGVDALVAAAQAAATLAEKAAQDAQAAADAVEDVTADTEAAKAAAQAAETARAAAVRAAQNAEQAAALAAQNAAADVASRLAGYVSDAEQAKQDAQSAAGAAAQNAVSAANTQLAGYVSAAQAAQRAAEQARDEAQGIAGGDFASTAYVDGKAQTAESNAKSYTDQKIAAIPIPDVSEQIGAHNTAASAHNDIRLLITELTTRLNALANSEDVDLDQMAELVAYIKDNRELIEQITTNKVSVSDIINNLTTNVSNKPLSAAQGVALKALADAASNAAGTARSTAETAKSRADAAYSLAEGKQNKITGRAGQVVGFDASGNPVAQETPSGGGTDTLVVTGKRGNEMMGMYAVNNVSHTFAEIEAAVKAGRMVVMEVSHDSDGQTIIERLGLSAYAEGEYCMFGYNDSTTAVEARLTSGGCAIMYVYFARAGNENLMPLFAGSQNDAQAHDVYLLRNSRLSSTDSTPTVNGEICWTYG